jgi:transcriptional regulator GlxA family with amidase domain
MPRQHATAPRTKRVAMLAYPDVQILDVVGPLEVFSRASRLLQHDHGRRDEAYTVEILGLKRGAFRASSGLRLYADRAVSEVDRGIDTLMVAGGIGAERFHKHPTFLRFIRQQASRVRRLASVCTGAFFLAEGGLLSGGRATTHWASCADLARRYPDVQVEPDTLFVREGSVYTAAGVTAGMDLALALVEEDHGRDVALAVARALVMFLKRPGGQAQFSAQLSQQIAEREPLSDLQAYILDNPRGDLSVVSLARRMGMSPRNFARVFTFEVGTTPARFVNTVRVEMSRRLLEESSDDLETISSLCGLGTPVSMRRAFLRTVGVAPSEYRERFNSNPARANGPKRVA